MDETRIDDGGPAFPTDNEQQNGASSYHYQGMGLRDWFAGQALTGLQASPNVSPSTPVKAMAEGAYRLADAMLAARKSVPQ